LIAVALDHPAPSESDGSSIVFMPATARQCRQNP
jgi:hypothetical protein